MTIPTTPEDAPLFSFVLSDDFGMAVKLGVWVVSAVLLLVFISVVWL